MKAILRSYHNETSHTDKVVDIHDDHDFGGGPYQDTVPFAVGSNQSILDSEDAFHRLKAHPLHDSSATGGAIRFIHSDGEVHEFYSWVNRMTGSRMSGFDNDPPTVGDSLKWARSVARDITARRTVLDRIGNLNPEP
jgi:hypothetical protein